MSHPVFMFTGLTSDVLQALPSTKRLHLAFGVTAYTSLRVKDYKSNRYQQIKQLHGVDQHGNKAEVLLTIMCLGFDDLSAGACK